MRKRSYALALALLILPMRTHAPAQQATFSVQSDLVVLHVSVKDRRGAYVTDLPRDAFEVFDEGRPRPIEFLAHTDTPVTVGLLVDSSGSMMPTRELVIAAAAAFAEASHPEDEIFALAFNEHVRAALPPSEPFTSDANTLSAALERTISARGRTALYDAVLAGLEYLSLGKRARRVLVVVSDGGDNASRATREEVFKKAQASNAMIYTLALRDTVRPQEGDPGWLRELAQATGGAAFRPQQPQDVATALREIATDIRHTYTIGYIPTQGDRDGRYHRVRVEVDSPDGRPLRVRSRGGYLAGSPR
jgi:Ca-activated chloride channel family protein